MSDNKDQLTALFKESGPAHHRAYIETDGDDPEWPIWYADYLQPELNTYLGVELTKSMTVYWLIKLDQDYRAASTKLSWPEWYSNILIEAHS